MNDIAKSAVILGSANVLTHNAIDRIIMFREHYQLTKEQKAEASKLYFAILDASKAICDAMEKVSAFADELN